MTYLLPLLFISVYFTAKLPNSKYSLNIVYIVKHSPLIAIEFSLCKKVKKNYLFKLWLSLALYRYKK